MSGRIRGALGALPAGAAILASVLLTSPAEASSVTVHPGDYGLPAAVVFEAGPGEANRVTVSRSGTDLVVTDTGSVIQSEDCDVQDDGHRAVCGSGDAPPAVVGAWLLDGNDVFACALTEPLDGDRIELEADGGTGNDVLDGCDTASGAGSDTLRGRGGDDTLRGRGGDDELTDDAPGPDDGGGAGGADRLHGGAGADRLDAGSGADEVHGDGGTDAILNLAGADGDDTYDGGSGYDEVAYELAPDSGTEATGADVRLDADGPTPGNGLPGEADVLVSVEDVTGSRGADALTGSARGNVLSGGAGDDKVIGGAGSDNLDGGAGADALDAQDGEVDRVGCGGDAGDTASVDDVDEVAADCPPAGRGTTVTDAPPPPGPIVIRDLRDSVRAVILSLSASRRVVTRKLRRRGVYELRLQVNETVAGEFSLTGRLRGGRIARAGHLTLARARRAVAPGVTQAVRLRIPRATRRVLRRGRWLRLTVQLRDGGGNLTTRRVAVKLT